MDSFVFWKITVSDIIQIIGLIVTIWIAIIVQKNLTKNRYLKEYFINELKNLREEYRMLCTDLQASKLSSGTIKARLKILSLRLKSIEKYTNIYFSLASSKLIELHSDFQQFVTGAEEFNEQYRDASVTLSDTVITQILEHQKTIVDEITMRIININNASRRFRWWLVRNKA